MAEEAVAMRRERDQVSSTAKSSTLPGPQNISILDPGGGRGEGDGE
jgi:hypothetical protein